MKITINDWPLGRQKIEVAIVELPLDKRSAIVKAANGSYPFTGGNVTGKPILSNDVFWYPFLHIAIERIEADENDAAWLALADEIDPRTDEQDAPLQLGGAGVLGVCGMAARAGYHVNYGKRTPEKWYEDIK